MLRSPITSSDTVAVSLLHTRTHTKMQNDSCPCTDHSNDGNTANHRDNSRTQPLERTSAAIESRPTTCEWLAGTYRSAAVMRSSSPSHNGEQQGHPQQPVVLRSALQQNAVSTFPLGWREKRLRRPTHYGRQTVLIVGCRPRLGVLVNPYDRSPGSGEEEDKEKTKNMVARKK
jgi:hypothetical protein